MRLKLEEGDTDTAMALAKKAFALRPDNERVLRTLFDLQSKTGGLGRRARDADRLDPRPAPAARRRHPPRRGAVARRRAGGARPPATPRAATRRRCRRTSWRRRWCRRRRWRRGCTPSNGAKRKATKTLTSAWAAQPASGAGRRLRRDRAGRDPGGAAQALRDADRRQPEPCREPAARGRAGAGRRGLSGRPQGAGRSRRDRADHPQPGADGGDRARPGRAGRGGARLARQGAQRLARAAVDLRQLHPHPCRLGAGLRELRRLRHARLADAGHGGTPASPNSAMLPLIIGSGPAAPEAAEPRNDGGLPQRREPRPEVEDAELASVADQARMSGAG